jgi:hypothetical protein
MLRLRLRRRPAIDRARVTLVSEDNRRQCKTPADPARDAARRRRKAHPFDEPPPREFAVRRVVGLVHERNSWKNPPQKGSRRLPTVHCAEIRGGSQLMCSFGLESLFCAKCGSFKVGVD